MAYSVTCVLLIWIMSIAYKNDLQLKASYEASPPCITSCLFEKSGLCIAYSVTCIAYLDYEYLYYEYCLLPHCVEEEVQGVQKEE